MSGLLDQLQREKQRETIHEKEVRESRQKKNVQRLLSISYKNRASINVEDQSAISSSNTVSKLNLKDNKDIILIGY